MYEGYSLKFLSEWCKKEIPNNRDINEENIDLIIEKFKYLKKDKETYIYYLALCKFPISFTFSIVSYTLSLYFIKSSISSFSLLSICENKVSSS